jgi:hypothetical protein
MKALNGFIFNNAKKCFEKGLFVYNRDAYEPAYPPIF